MASKEKIIWLLGSSREEKTNLGYHLVDLYKALAILCLWLDGDRVRQELSQELGFSLFERMGNHRKIIEGTNISEENE